MASRGGRATLATVAASAGVSVATVSKVVNGRNDVGPATRARIETLLREHDYVGRRSEAARPAGTTDPSVELVLHSELNPYGTEILQGVLDTGTELGVAVAVSLRPRGHGPRSADWVRELARAGRQAVIDVVNDLSARDLSLISKAHVPLVVIDPLSLPRVPVTSVGATNFAGGFAATQHLLSLGHRRIAYLGGVPGAACNQARLHGYRAAMEAAEAPILDGYLWSGRFVYESGIEGGAVILDRPERPTAVFAASDETAAGVVEAARCLGLRVPDDLSVVGFDDTQVARFVSPPLTTVRQPLREIGGVALRTALRLAAGEKLVSHHVELATELIVRSSTAPPPVGS